MRKRHARPIAVVLFAIYSLIALSPISAMAFKSTAVSHAITGGCTGDCKSCGCSPERSASHTCCCWINRMRGKESFLGISICRMEDGKEKGHGARMGKLQKKRLTLFRCSPCGRNNSMLPWSSESHPHLPCLFSREIESVSAKSSAKPPPDLLKSRHGDPPDPPPKVFLLS